MADVETGKIENDKEKKIIDEMANDRAKLEDAILQVTAAEIREESTNENPSSVLSKSEEKKDGSESGRELVQNQSNSDTDQLCIPGESSTELDNLRGGQSINSENVDKSEEIVTEKSEETKIENTDKTEEPCTEIMNKTEGPRTDVMNKVKETSPKITKETEGQSSEIDKMEEPRIEMIDNPEGPITGITDQASEASTEKTQLQCNNEITQKSKEHQNTVGTNNIIPQSEVTAVIQAQITKDEVLPDQNPCSVETTQTKSNDERGEKNSKNFSNFEIEMMDQSELGPSTSEAEVMMVSESEISKPSENDGSQEKCDKGKEAVDVSDPPTDNGNKYSDSVSETLKMSSSDSSLDSKKENLFDTSYSNEINRKSALTSSDTIQLPMEVDNESIQSETAMFDTPGPATPASSIVEVGSVSAGPTPSKRSRQNSTGSGANVEAASEDLENHTFPASRVFEYQWPKDSSGEYYMLQEQISEFLGVKSFKRKYPELQRRPVEMNERMFLREKGAVTETQCDLGLTAIRSDEVYDLMHRDYPDKYAEYAAVLHERERQTIKEKHKDYEVPKLEKSKMTEYIQKAMKSASEWNTSFLRERKEERRAYFDLQTFNVHYPAGRFKVLPTELTSPSPYPVTLIPGQYQDYYKSHSTEELKYLPLNTALYNPPKQMGNSLANPQEVLSEDASEEDAEGGGGSDSESDDDSSSGDSDDSSEQDSSQVVSNVTLKGGKTEDDLTCRMCEKQGETDEDMVQCSECKKFGHPTCLDLTTEMVTVIKTYPWQCMECKTCVECMDPYDEDKMIFCDRCDRGYHTFCVGLRSIPNGQWKCRSCKSPDTPRTPKSSSKLRGRGRKRGNNTPAKDG